MAGIITLVLGFFLGISELVMIGLIIREFYLLLSGAPMGGHQEHPPTEDFSHPPLGGPPLGPGPIGWQASQQQYPPTPGNNPSAAVAQVVARGLSVSDIKELVRQSGMDPFLRRKLIYTETPLSYLQKLSNMNNTYAYFCSQVVSGNPFSYSLFSTFLTQVLNVLKRFSAQLNTLDPSAFQQLHQNLQVAIKENSGNGVLTKNFWDTLIAFATDAGISSKTSSADLQKEYAKYSGYPSQSRVGGFRDSVGKGNLDSYIKRVETTLNAVETIISNWEHFRNEAYKIDQDLRKRIK